ncbi:MAG: mechanosensitive ion channel family protein [Bacteroidales bacterium]|nr:mechanosensitive ion channel family protein [Bacteroidales bacterium]
MKDIIFSNEYFGNSLLDWLISLAYVVGAIVLGKILYWFSNKILKGLTKKSKTSLDDIIIDLIEEPVVFAVILSGIWIAVTRLSFPDSIIQKLYIIFQILITINITWLIVRLVISLVNQYFILKESKSDSKFDSQIIPIVKKSLKTIIWIFGIVLALNNAGYDVGALIAGLGIGGIALAMAAKDSISNIFGGFTIFADKPFKLGDRVRISGYDGFVEDIGLRSSRIRTIDGTLVTIPNSKITDSVVENVTKEPSRKIVVKLGLNYNTPLPKIELAMSLLKTIAQNNTGVEDTYNVAFNEFADSSLNLLFVYYIIKGSDIPTIQTEINLSILKNFNENEISFAFPTRSVYLEK